MNENAFHHYYTNQRQGYLIRFADYFLMGSGSGFPYQADIGKCDPVTRKKAPPGLLVGA